MDQTQLKNALSEVLDEKFGPLSVDLKTHKKDHEFVGRIRKRTEKIGGGVWQMLGGVLVIALLGLLARGILMWSKGQ